MLFYLYVSQTKVDMLFGQLGIGEVKTTQTRSSVSVPKIASLERSTSQTQTASLFAKLEQILNHLTKNGQLVTLRKVTEERTPPRFIVDSGPWKALLIGKDYLIANNQKLVEDEKNRPAPTSYAVFCSRPECLVFLVGSPAHVIGMSSNQGVPYAVISPSYTMDNYIMSLKEGNSQRPEDILPGIIDLFTNLWLAPEKNLKVCFVVYNQFEINDALWEKLVTNFEFRGVAPPSRPKIIVLGSPLFVALG